MKTFHRIFLIVLFLTCAQQCGVFAQDATGDVWVNIRFQDRGADQPAIEYYGVIRKADLLAMLNPGKMTGFVKMTRVALMENGQISPLADTLANGSKFGFKNVVYIRVDTILRIVELDDTFVTQRLLPLKE